MKRTISFSIAVAMLVLCSCACKGPKPVLSYDFSSPQVASLMHNGASAQKLGKLTVLDLGTSDGYLDMGAEAGRVLAGLDDFTVSAYCRYDGDPDFPRFGYFLWTFSTEPECGPRTGRYFAYRLNEQRVETSIGGYTQESIIMKGTKSEAGVWKHILYVQQGSLGSLYIDGELIGTNDSMPLMKENFAEPPTCNWIGRPAFRGDNYLKGAKVYGFSIYDVALSEKEINKLSDFTLKMPAE